MKPKPLGFTCKVLRLEQELPDVSLGTLSTGEQRWRIVLGLDNTTFLTIIVPPEFLPPDTQPDLAVNDEIDLIVNVPLRSKDHAIPDQSSVTEVHQSDPDGGLGNR